jgi:tetratricopeptide (TPR) repeat protein
MYVGEQSHIKVHPRFTDDPDGNDILEFELEFLEVQSADTLHLSARISEAREAGNDYYKRGRYEKALRLYDYGIRLLTDAEESVEDNDLRKYTFLANSAACLIKVCF